MVNVIDLIEKDNRLDFLNTYKPIVSGNSNYVLRFQFSAAWSQFKRKTAVFMIEDKKHFVDFENNECKVPIMPNAPFVFVSLICGCDGEQLVTTSLKIRMENTVGAKKLAEFENKNESLARLFASLNKIEKGNFYVKKSKFAENVINKNQLLNSNFRVNQRGLEMYESTGEKFVYTVDRWSISNYAKVMKTFNGVRLIFDKPNAIFRQKFEFANELAGETVTVSAKISNSKLGRVSRVLQVYQNSPVLGRVQPFAKIVGDGVVSYTVQIQKEIFDLDVRIVSYANGFETDEFDVEWVKLEIGENRTDYKQISFGEDYALCRRFYYKSQNNHICKFARNGYQFYDNIIRFVSMRNIPNITVFSAESNKKNCLKCGENNVEVVCLNGTNDSFHIQAAKGEFVADCVYRGWFILDAEIY